MAFVYFGSNTFSVTVLEELATHNLAPSLIVTVPDAPVGRKKIMTPPPIKAIAEQFKIPLIQPSSLSRNQDLAAKIQETQSAFGIVAAYSKLIPNSVIKLFPNGIINVHPSLLPLWRGPSPIESALFNGDEKTGITVIQLDEEFDHGPILAQEELAIKPDEYFFSLYRRLAKLGGEMLCGLIPAWLAGSVIPKPQRHERATFSRMLFLQDGKINPHRGAQETYNQIRAFSFEPGCWMECRMKTNKSLTLKIHAARPIPDVRLTMHTASIGLAEAGKKLVLFCTDGALELERVQPESGKEMSGKEFLNGYRSKLAIPLLP